MSEEWTEDWRPTCFLDDSGGEYPCRGQMLKVSGKILCENHLRFILELGFVHPETPVPLEVKA